MRLTDLMEFGHVVYSDGQGNVTDETGPAHARLHAPTPYVDLDDDGQMISLDPADIHDVGDWVLLTGFSGQDRYAGPIMHESEFIGGGLERHIRDTPGWYAAVVVNGYGPDPDDLEDPCVGWAVAYRLDD